MKKKEKKADQKIAKQRHREQLRSNRKTEPSIERSEPSLSERPTILIVCEGRNTEPSYFMQFRLASATIKSVGEGYNTMSLIKRAIQIDQQGDFEQVWCVFDKDDFKDKDFNNAISLAEANNFGVAYSNQAFEYWIILHFEDHQGTGMRRSDYNKKFNNLLLPFGLHYDGKDSKIISEEIFELLDGIDDRTKKERKQLACSRAERNYNQFDHVNPAKEESSTTVFRLVKELLKYT